MITKENPGTPSPIESLFESCVREGAQAPTAAEGAKRALKCFVLRLGAMAATADPDPGAGEGKPPEASR